MNLIPGLLAGLAFLSVGYGMRGASEEEFPFQVCIQDVNGNTHLCGGVIITPTWILTVRECVKHSLSMVVAYGSVDCNQPAGKIPTKKIVFESAPGKVHNLALLEIESPIPYSKKAKQARLPKITAELLGNTTKLTGWNVNSIVHRHPTLDVIDRYKVLFQDCKLPSGSLVHLEPDEFCGFDEEFPDYFSMNDLGSTVTKEDIVIGLLPKKPPNLAFPVIFVKVSEHEKWIIDNLEDDAKNIIWVNEIPKDSADSCALTNLTLLLSSFLLARLV